MRVLRKWITYLPYVLLSLFVLFPFLWGLRTSLAEQFDRHLIPSHFTLQHFHALLSRPDFFLYLRNSLAVAVASILITLIISALGGYALARLRFKGRSLGGLLLILPLLPPVDILVPLITYFQRLGLYNTLLAVVIANVVFSLPLTVWMMRNFILSNPVEIEESARIDGCSRCRMLYSIVLPMVGPGLVAVALFVFINSWTTYLFAFALNSTHTLRGIPQGI